MGRKKRISTYISKSLRKTKNIHTRRTHVALITRDIRKLSTQKKNKRLKP